MTRQFDYQRGVMECFSQTRDHILVAQPTGTGKTRCCVNVVESMLASNRRSIIWIGIPNVVLGNQWSGYFPSLKKSIVIGRNPDVSGISVNNISIMTYEHMAHFLINKDPFRPDLLILDEVQLIFDEGRGILVKLIFDHLTSRNIRSILLSGSLQAMQIDRLMSILPHTTPFVSFSTPYDRQYHVMDGRMVSEIFNSYIRLRGSKYKSIVFTVSKKSTYDLAHQIVGMIDGWKRGCAPLPERIPWTSGEDEERIKMEVMEMGRSGIVIHYRGIGSEYSRYVIDSLMDNRSTLLISTSTMKEGVDIPHVKEVFINVFGSSLKRLGAHEVNQMIGRGFRTCSSVVHLSREALSISSRPSSHEIPSSYHPIMINMHFPSILEEGFTSHDETLNSINKHIQSSNIDPGDPILTVLILANWRMNYDPLTTAFVTFAIIRQDILDGWNKKMVCRRFNKEVRFDDIFVDGIINGHDTRRCDVLFNVVFWLLFYGREEHDRFIQYSTPYSTLSALASHFTNVSRIFCNMFSPQLVAISSILNEILSSLTSLLSDTMSFTRHKMLSPMGLVDKDKIGWWDLCGHHNRMSSDGIMGLGHFDETICILRNRELYDSKLLFV
jgi:hypothetical protein